MRESYEPNDKVLVFDTQGNRARAEHGDTGALMAARPAVIEADVTPHGSKWDPFGGDPARRGGAYVDSGPEGPATYQLRFEDGSTETANVHRLAVASEIAAGFHRRAQASEAHAQAASDEAAKHQAEAERLHAAAQAIAIHQQQKAGK